ncbi:MAG TPA: hypothetical protein VMI52_14460 [Acetobacteraceae bacterium]|nr:hypothetical protein [Acetobacteraceae bacterium]
MTPIDEVAAKSKGPTGEGPHPSSATPEAGGEQDLLALTIHGKTGQVVKVEDVDGTGAHHEVSDEKKANLAKEIGDNTLESLLEQAFEAGIACALGEEIGQDEVKESKEEADIRHRLLQRLIKNSAARRLMQREVLNRAILGTLIHP